MKRSLLKSFFCRSSKNDPSSLGTASQRVRLRRLAIPVVCGVLVAALAQPNVVEAGRHLRKAATDRGVAILSPLESPDPCDAPVGGSYRYTPYYPGYAPDRRCPVIYESGGYNGYVGPGAFGSTPAAYARGDYGVFSGGSKDEENLLHLGGRGLANQPSNHPYVGTVDMIDRIQGQR